MNKISKFQKSKGFTLIEIMLAISITLIATIGIYYMLGKSQASASIEQEQKHISALSEGVQNFFVTNGTYDGLTTELVANSNITGIRRGANNTLISSFKTPIQITPATVRQTNDAFDVEYSSLNNKQCLELVNNVYHLSFDTIIDGQSSQHTTGNKEGSLMDSAIIISRCSNERFQKGQGSVAFRFFTPNSGATSPVVDACSCSPQTQTQTLACPAGQEGSIDQSRTSTCTGGTLSCRTPIWSSWTTTLNTCSPVTTSPTPCPPGGCIAPPPNVCVPTTETRIEPCPTGQEGGITQNRSSACPTPQSEPVWGSWTTVQNTCQPIVEPPAICEPWVDYDTQNCPTGQGGQIRRERQNSCTTPYSTPTIGSWQIISNNCSQTCNRALPSGSGGCCRVSTQEQDRIIQRQCENGQYGVINVQQERIRHSTCSSASASPTWPSWPAWVDITSSGTCTGCPPSAIEPTFEWWPQSESCPPGEIGTISWEAEMKATRGVYYDCPAGTSTLPPPSYTSWSDFEATGRRRNEVNTCEPVAPPPSTECSISSGQTFSWTVNGNSCSHKASGSTILDNGKNYSAQDTVAPFVGSAQFSCNNGVMSTTPNAGATCASSGGGELPLCDHPFPTGKYECIYRSVPPAGGAWDCDQGGAMITYDCEMSGPPVAQGTIGWWHDGSGFVAYPPTSSGSNCTRRMNVELEILTLYTPYNGHRFWYRRAMSSSEPWYPVPSTTPCIKTTYLPPTEYPTFPSDKLPWDN